MAKHIRFDSDDEYQPSDSEDELSENERALLSKARNKKQQYSDSEEEILGVHSESEGSDIALSDVEGQDDDDDMPDPKAWGKNKKNYYATDYVDPDYGGFQGKDANLAELEEEEARNLQNELAKSLDDDDFSLGFLTQKKEVEVLKHAEEVIKTDTSKLSKRQKLELLTKESPEFFILIEDYEKKMDNLRDFINPVMELYKTGNIKSSDAVDFVKSYQEIILNYSTNIYMYLLLKASKSAVQKHPIIKRLFQYRQLLTQLDPVFEESIKPQLEVLIDLNKGNTSKTTKKKKLKLLTDMQINQDKNTTEKSKKKKIDSEDDDLEENLKASNKRVKFNNEVAVKLINNDSGEESEAEEKEVEEQEDETVGSTEEIGKRRITYQIAKNKGIMPSRKKEQRNPRVKHRNKFRKANIRRKGAVREVRTETSRYGGEISGIKASVTKSIKIKA